MYVGAQGVWEISVLPAHSRREVQRALKIVYKNLEVKERCRWDGPACEWGRKRDRVGGWNTGSRPTDQRLPEQYSSSSLTWQQR